ncbi:M12 family metallo-peptidase [Aquimarina sp. RZ0]|uniref:M12 family metallo-peptidase n=1 Tax=Aquimarina sp. RZ0 TaxID=2607730 RepID=UPI0011F0C419|nr:M12 family metallo-peptidase [Aquimarina sp. RZ0]KAA1242113.1 T9SS type A sorting domain-containing protein [Aquimarina sp. RZ0]
MKLKLSVLLIALFSAIGFSQNKSLKPLQLITEAKFKKSTFTNIDLFSVITNQKSNVEIPEELKNDYTLFSLNTQKLKSTASNAPSTMNFAIPGQSKSSMILELVKVNITSDNFELVEMPSGKRIQPNKTIAHYRGIVQGKPNSIAAISLLDGEVTGLISIDGDKGNLVLGKLDNSAEHIIYKDENLIHLNNFTCNTEADFSGYSEEQLSDPSLNKAERNCVKVFFDIGNDVVRDKGGSQEASDYLQAVFNQVAILYANDEMTVKIGEINAWTEQNPFSGLRDYSRYRENNGLNGSDLGHFVTYNFSGGVAYLNSVCNRNFRYGVSGIGKSFREVPRFSFTVEVIAHELGHNLGSNHTQACVWNGNNTAIDGCSSVEGNCARPGVPDGGGTIMSYCHLTREGINFSKGFGVQPGNVIRNTIAAARCLEVCGDVEECNDGDAATVTFENNSACILEYVSGTTSQFSIGLGETREVSTTIGTNWTINDPTNASVSTFSIECKKNIYTFSDTCTNVEVCEEGDVITVIFENNSACTLEYLVGNTSLLSIGSGETKEVSTAIGANWSINDPVGAEVSDFIIECDKNSYTYSGTCTNVEVCDEGDTVTVIFENNSACILEYFTDNTPQFSMESGETKEVSTEIGSNWTINDPTDVVVATFAVECDKDTYTFSGNCTNVEECDEGDEVTVTFENKTDCELEYFIGTTSQFSIAVDESREVSTSVGTDWIANDSEDGTVNTFSIECDKNNYIVSGRCSDTGSDTCDGVPEWSRTETYSTGDRVVYRGYLFEKLTRGWRFIQVCVTNFSCIDVSEWSYNRSYSVGDRVTYRNNLYERTFYGWRFLGSCNGTSRAYDGTTPSDLLNDSDIKIYPNPAEDVLNIEINNLENKTSRFFIRDINGRTLKSMLIETPPGSNYKEELTVSDLPSGVYFIQFNGNKKSITKKLIKK